MMENTAPIFAYGKEGGREKEEGVDGRKEG